MQIGAQLYTAHDYTKTLEDFDQTLKKVAEMGYKSVQVSGTCAFEPEWLREKLEQYGLTCVLTHIAPAKLLENPEQVVRDHAVFGCRNIGIGGLPKEARESLEGYRAFCAQFIPAAKKASEMGAKIHYHNHSYEFEEKLEGKTFFERMLEDFPADLIDFTLDLGWAAFAGEDVVKRIEQLKGRLSRIHLKDYADLPEDGSIETRAYLRPIFEGKLDYDAYIKALAAAGTEYMLVEQDWCYEEGPFVCLKRSYDNVTARFPETK